MPIEEIDADEAAARLAAGVPLFDVRQPDEYHAGHVPGAVLVPMGEVPDRLEELRVEGPVLLVCRSGARSMRVCEYLQANGIEGVNLGGGTLAWVASGRDVVTGSEPS